MRLLSWNINQPGAARTRAILEAVQSRQPDLVALQEVASWRVGALQKELSGIGFPYSTSSVEVVPAGSDRQSLGYCVLPATRWPLRELANDLEHIVKLKTRLLDEGLSIKAGYKRAHICTPEEVLGYPCKEARR